MRRTVVFLVLLAVMPMPGVAQSSAPLYRPKSANDKARSEAEFSALAYMRTVIAAEKNYHKKHHRYAPSLQALVGQGSFTKRMANPSRGEYSVGYRALPDGYELMLTPHTFDDRHRAFYVDQRGRVRAEQGKRADASSPPLS